MVAFIRLPELLHPFNGADNIRKADTKFFINYHGYAACHHFAVDIHFQRLSSELVQLYHRTLPKLEQFVDQKACTPKFETSEEYPE